MTYTYSKQVSSVRLLGFARLLFIWRASIYKLVFREIFIFCSLYGVLSLLYRFVLSTQHRKLFEQVVIYCATFEGTLPLTFILGFYVTFVANRWWLQFSNIAWPDRIMVFVSTMVDGESDRAVMIRRTLMRYLFLAQCILMSSISKPVRKRFPQMQSLVEHGIMTQAELQAINDERVPSLSNKYWVPTQWFANLLVRARNENFIKDMYSFNTLLNELCDYKRSLGTIASYDWINVPLVYTQVATISVYVFFTTTLLSRQFIEWPSVKEQYKEHASARYSIDMYFPIFTVLQLFFYIGWLKVAEQMLNPFGEDDDDFECNWILDRNFKVGFCAVHSLYQYHPPLIKDEFWNNINPELSYTVASERFKLPNGWHGSLHNLSVSSHSFELVLPASSSDLTAHSNQPKDFNSLSHAIAEEDSSTKSKQPFPSLRKLNNLKRLVKSRKLIPSLLLHDKLYSNTSNHSAVNSPVENQRFFIGSAPPGFLSQLEKCHSETSCNLQRQDFELLNTNHSKSSTNDYVQQWIKKNELGEDFIASQLLSSSACQLSMVDEKSKIYGCGAMADEAEAQKASSFLDKHKFSETASVGNLSKLEDSMPIQHLIHNNSTDLILDKKVAFETTM